MMVRVGKRGRKRQKSGRGRKKGVSCILLIINMVGKTAVRILLVANSQYIRPQKTKLNKCGKYLSEAK